MLANIFWQFLTRTKPKNSVIWEGLVFDNTEEVMIWRPPQPDWGWGQLTSFLDMSGVKLLSAQ